MSIVECKLYCKNNRIIKLEWQGIEKEKRGEVTLSDIKKYLDKKYKVKGDAITNK